MPTGRSGGTERQDPARAAALEPAGARPGTPERACPAFSLFFSQGRSWLTEDVIRNRNFTGARLFPFIGSGLLPEVAARSWLTIPEYFAEDANGFARNHSTIVDRVF